ncbi:terpene synthase family protein [Actinomadura fibrosa]|uniref:Terpene synthase family protein n=1 Tax=Actinomadura fibrosa TaxID=111802 RepID=A0ABW2XW85_9ACTN|nr:terpene synthase family protein [Actinomadura fibrosa]
MDTYQMPDLRLPFATATHPLSGLVQESTERWCRAHGLLRSPDVAAKFRALGYGRVMSTLCPHAPLAGMALITDWNSLFFITDDQQNNAVTTGRTGLYEDLVDRMRALIAGDDRDTDLGGHPLLGALRDLLDRTLPGRPPAWAARFRRDLDLWLRGHLAENSYRVSGTVPDVAAYIAVRRDASTVLPTLDLVELVEGATVPDELYRTPEYQTLILGTADIMCWINDIHSLHMERDDPINLVTVLAHHRRRGVRNAVADVAARVAARVEEYLAAAEALPSAMDRLGMPEAAQLPVMRCVRDQQSWAAGMENWDRTDTIRFAPSEIPEPGRNASYVQDLLDRSATGGRP